MNSTIVKINEGDCTACEVDFSLSFRPLIKYLRDRLKTEQTLKIEFYRFLLDKIEAEEALKDKINVEDLVKYKDVLELIFSVLTPLMANEKDLYWAMSTPIPDSIFFSTDAFFDFFTLQRKEKKLKGIEESNDKQQLQFIYKIILNRFYNYTSLTKNEILYVYNNPKTQLTTYYNINPDSQFVDIHFDGELPVVNFELIGSQIDEDEELIYLKQVLPLQKFKFDGFSVVTLTDVTLQHAIDGIREALANHTYEEEAYQHVIQALKTLAGNGYIEFGLLPLLKVNDKFVFDCDLKSQSILLDSAKKEDLEEETFFALISNYIDYPRAVFFNELTDDKIKNFPFLTMLRNNGVKSYSFLPLYYNKELVGIMEVYAREELLVNENILTKFHSALPLLGQLLKYKIEEFEAKLDKVLKDKFTALKPSVQWKFNEVVWNYLKVNKQKKRNIEIETVTFKNLYPLFGAIDIRNSTIERNYALKADLKTQLAILCDTLNQVKETYQIEAIDEVLMNCKIWDQRIEMLINSSEEAELNEFLDLKVYPILKNLEERYPDANDKIRQYFNAILVNTGSAFEHRRKLEQSINLINNTVGDYLENSQNKIQETYPCYFAKFRTDGIEYDIYIGQDIAPENPFDLINLSHLRFWQLTSMVEIARLSYSLVDQMERVLYTTQLIFIYSNTIDISFRNDERRFDVEGAYNIRYEIIKKRIDKVLLIDSTERLTQPGKIALVYFNSSEEKEYLVYIEQLQKKGLLLNDLEIIELANLQGITGLKALRVGVNYLNLNVIENVFDK